MFWYGQIKNAKYKKIDVKTYNFLGYVISNIILKQIILYCIILVTGGYKVES